MSEAERQRYAMELKLKERQLRQKGMHDEAAQLLNQYLTDTETMKRLAEDERQEMERIIRERLQRKQKRIDEGKFNNVRTSVLV